MTYSDWNCHTLAMMCPVHFVFQVASFFSGGQPDKIKLLQISRAFIQFNDCYFMSSNSGHVILTARQVVAGSQRRSGKIQSIL